MVDIFVNKSGNDGNSGLTRALAKLTLGGAYAIVASGDFIKVGAGDYNEVVVAPIIAGTGFTVEADFDDAFSAVVFDGTSSLVDFWTGIAGGKGAVWKGIVFRNYTGAIFRGTGAAVIASFLDCMLESSEYGLRHTGGSSMLEALATESRRNIIRDMAVTGIQEVGSGGIGPQRWKGNTIVGCGAGGLDWRPTGGGSDRSIKWQNGIIKDCPVLVRLINASNRYTGDFNDLVFAGGDVAVLSSVTHVTLAALVAAFVSGQEANSVDVDPVFVDEAQRMLRLDPTSTVLIGLGNGDISHAGFSGQPTHGQSTNRNAAEWNGAVINDMTLVGGKYELTTPPDGDVAPDVIDFGKSTTVRRVVVKGVENYPLEVMDKDNTDVQPNRRQMEYRISDTVFLKGAGVPAFVSFVNGEDLKVSGRFFQVRVTTINNGVAA